MTYRMMVTNPKLLLSIGLHILLFCLLFIASDKKPLPEVEPHITAQIIDMRDLPNLSSESTTTAVAPQRSVPPSPPTSEAPTKPVQAQVVKSNSETPIKPAISKLPTLKPNAMDGEFAQPAKPTPIVSKTTNPTAKPSESKVTRAQTEDADPFSNAETTAQLKKSQQEAAARRDANAQLIGQFQEKIHKKIESNWNVPENSESLQAMVRITLVPGGEIVSILITKSSGDAIFDSSLREAIKSASPLPVSSDPALFAQIKISNLTFSGSEK